MILLNRNLLLALMAKNGIYSIGLKSISVLPPVYEFSDHKPECNSRYDSSAAAATATATTTTTTTTTAATGKGQDDHCSM